MWDFGLRYIFHLYSCLRINIAFHKSIKVKTVRPGTPAEAAGLKASDLICRINGQIVFHLNPKDVERLINNSGFSLLLDIER